jgi:hypothetical protein
MALMDYLFTIPLLKASGSGIESIYLIATSPSYTFVLLLLLGKPNCSVPEDGGIAGKQANAARERVLWMSQWLLRVSAVCTPDQDAIAQHPLETEVSIQQKLLKMISDSRASKSDTLRE